MRKMKKERYKEKSSKRPSCECRQGHSGEVVITTFIEGVCLCLL